LVDAFKSSGLTHEAFITGQCAAVFVKLMVEDVFTKKGLYVPEQLDTKARAYFFKELAKLGVTVEETFVTL
jgi:saccharopine dehydrogenase-like NADP-dependent oxidoreductase